MDAVHTLLNHSKPPMSQEREREILFRVWGITKKITKLQKKAEAAEGAQKRAIEQKISGLEITRSQEMTDLVLCNLRLCRKIAKDMIKTGHHLNDDMLMSGVLGLMKAIIRYNPEQYDVRLQTYAGWYIRQAAQLQYDDQYFDVAIPRKLHQFLYADPAELNSLLSSCLDRGISPSTAENAIRCSRMMRADVNHDYDVVETIAAKDGNGPDIDHDLLNMAMAELTPRERHILELRFGLKENDAMTLSQIGDVLKVSKERIRQIESGAMAKLRDLLSQEQVLG